MKVSILLNAIFIPFLSLVAADIVETHSLRGDQTQKDLNIQKGPNRLVDKKNLRKLSSQVNPFYLTESGQCPPGFKRASIRSPGLNGDLNQSAGGKDIFLCTALDQTPVSAVKLVQSRSCGTGWKKASREPSLNGDLNQGAGGKDIFLCFSLLSDHTGERIQAVNIVRYKPVGDKMVQLPDGLNGDLNQSAGGKDIFLELIKESVAPQGPIFFSESDGCPGGYTRAPQIGLNGDLNQSAGGKDIFLCLALDAFPIYGIKLVQNRWSCGLGWQLADYGPNLNGDLNQSAGGKDIFLCYQTVASGNRISNIYVQEHRPPNDKLPLLPDGLNGDLNEGAGGKDIFLELHRENYVPQSAIYFSEAATCPQGYNLPTKEPTLNGDLNQGAGGKDIFLCLALGEISIYGVKLVQNSDSCGSGWELAAHPSSLNGDLNQNAGGKDIFLCFTRLRSSSQSQPIRNIYMRESRPLAERMLLRPDGLNGDLNQGAGGKDIFMELYYDDAVGALPSRNSLPAHTNYNFGVYPQPGYLPVEVCGGLIWSFGCTNYGPCWHAQQLVTFVDADNLYTFYTMSQSRHGKAYLLKTPLTKEASATLPAVPSTGTVQWYEETTNFNHPGDVVVKDRIILTANQNWDPTSDLQDFGCGALSGVTIGGGGCNCFSDLASKQQALTIWDFGSSLTSPKKYNINKWSFNAVIDGQMDSSDADDLWGGDVNGELVINFENFWLHWTGGNIGMVSNWREIRSVDLPACSGEIGSGAGKLFTRINGNSVLATFEVDNPCYSLRTVTYDKSTNSLLAPCASLQTICTPGGQLVDNNDKKRAFQTITEGSDGRVYITSLDIHGTKTSVMVSKK